MLDAFVNDADSSRCTFDVAFAYMRNARVTGKMVWRWILENWFLK